MKSAILITLIASCLAIAHATRLAPLLFAHERDVIPNEYIVSLRSDLYSSTSASSLIRRMIRSIGLTRRRVIHEYFNGFAATLSARQVEALREMPEVDFIEPNQVVTLAAEQDDVPSWGLARVWQREFNNKTTYQYPDNAGENVDAYIIDTGINIEHEDFEGRAEWGFTAIRGQPDTDGNGHGSHVASTVAGKTYGIAKFANLTAVKVLSASGSGSTAGVIAGIEWVTKTATSKKNRKAVANMSLGGGKSLAMDNAVNNAVEEGVHFAVAAGNSNANACRYSPAGAKLVVTVAASNKLDRKSSFSNHGACVNIFAPGEQITGAWKGSATATNTISGTSMASPHVAGVMAVILSREDLNPAEMLNRLQDLATVDVLKGVDDYTLNLLLFSPANGTAFY